MPYGTRKLIENKNCLVCKRKTDDELFCHYHKNMDIFKKITYLAKIEGEKEKHRRRHWKSVRKENEKNRNKVFKRK